MLSMPVHGPVSLLFCIFYSLIIVICSHVESFVVVCPPRVLWMIRIMSSLSLLLLSPLELPSSVWAPCCLHPPHRTDCNSGLDLVLVGGAGVLEGTRYGHAHHSLLLTAALRQRRIQAYFLMSSFHMRFSLDRCQLVSSYDFFILVGSSVFCRVHNRRILSSCEVIGRSGLMVCHWSSWAVNKIIQWCINTLRAPVIWSVLRLRWKCY